MAVIALGGVAICVAVATAGLAAIAPVGVPSRFTHPETRDLALAFPGWSAGRWELVRIAAIGCGLVVGAATGAWVVVAGAALGPSLVLRSRAARIRERAATRSIEVLQAVQAAMRSGMPLAPALRLALERVDPLGGDPFARALRAFDLNAALPAAFAEVRARTRDHRVTLALDALALVAGEELPAARGASLVASVVDRLTSEERLLEEMRARTSGLRTQIVILALLVPVIAAYLGWTMPGLAATLAAPLGRFVLLPAAATLELAGILASRAIVRDLGR